MKPTKLQREKIMRLIVLIEEIKALSETMDMQITKETENELYLIHLMKWDEIYTLFNKINIKN